MVQLDPELFTVGGLLIVTFIGYMRHRISAEEVGASLGEFPLMKVIIPILDNRLQFLAEKHDNEIFDIIFMGLCSHSLYVYMNNNTFSSTENPAFSAVSNQPFVFLLAALGIGEISGRIPATATNFWEGLRSQALQSHINPERDWRPRSKIAKILASIYMISLLLLVISLAILPPILINILPALFQIVLSAQVVLAVVLIAGSGIPTLENKIRRIQESTPEINMN